MQENKEEMDACNYYKVYNQFIDALLLYVASVLLLWREPSGLVVCQNRYLGSI